MMKYSMAIGAYWAEISNGIDYTWDTLRGHRLQVVHVYEPCAWRAIDGLEIEAAYVAAAAIVSYAARSSARIAFECVHENRTPSTFNKVGRGNVCFRGQRRPAGDARPFLLKSRR